MGQSPLTGAASFVARWDFADVRGTVVAVDVLRAFTTAAYAVDAGAAEIWLADGVDEAIELARSLPDAVVMGEEHGIRPEGFDLSNSPVEASRADLTGRPVVQRTSAGTRGVVAAANADRLFVASLVVATATAREIDRCTRGAPTYLITGRFDDDPTSGTDDLVTAEMIERIRLGLDPKAEETAEAVRTSDEAKRTLALGPTNVDPDDIAYATAIDRFDFAMEVERVEGLLRIRRSD